MDEKILEKTTTQIVSSETDQADSISLEKTDRPFLPYERIEDFSFIVERIKKSDDLEDIFVEDAEFIFMKLKTMEMDEAIEILKESVVYFYGDQNFPAKTMAKMHKMLEGEEAYGQGPSLYDLDVRLEASMIKYHSPYPEVRSVCSPVDDVNQTCETFRVYIIAGVWTAFAAFVNSLLNFRQPHFTLSSQVIQLLILPCGQTYAKIMPKWNIGFGRFKFQLNPGPWTFKEQMLSTIMANAGVSLSVFLWYMPTMRLDVFYGHHWLTYGFNILMGISCQYFGVGMAGILRRWVIYPVKAVWPTILPTLQLNRTLLLPESKTSANGWKITKYLFFNIVLGCSFIWFFIPDYLFTSLSTFNWPTWISPKNVNLAVMMGSKYGIGLNPISTFDWTVVNLSYPLIVPFYTVLNRYIGTFIAAMAVIGMFYSNYAYTGYLPPNTATVYDRYGKTYNTSAVLTNNFFDKAKYEKYSPPFITAGNIALNGAEYTITTFSFVYIILSEWSTFKEAAIGFYRGLKNRKISNYDQYKDPVSALMRNYEEVPDWWYIILLVGSIVVGIICITCWPTETPVWIYICVMLITLALLVPSMMMYSTTGNMFTVDVISTLFGGYWVPGSGLACLFTRTFSYGLDNQAETYVGDQKMGHYAKIPPKAVFRVQGIATLIQILVGMASWEMLQNGMPGLCTSTQASKFTCPFANTLYSQSVLLGVIGPARTFDTIYPVFKWAFLIGAGGAVPCFLIRKYFPKYFHLFHPVLILTGFIRWGANYNLSYYTPGLVVSFIFMFYIRRYYTMWWAKYNYIFSSALTAGTAFCGILIFLALQYHPKKLTWWGNTVSSAGVDGTLAKGHLPLPDVGYFGPANGTWH